MQHHRVSHRPLQKKKMYPPLVSYVASGQVEAEDVVEVSLCRNPKSPAKGRMRNSEFITSSAHDFIKDKFREVGTKRGIYSVS